MKKKLIILVAVIAICGVGALFWLVANANSLIESRRADIEKIASDALSARVTFGKINTSLFPEARILVSDLNVKPLKAGNGEQEPDGVTLKSFVAHVGLFPLLGGKLDVRKLSIEEPSLTVISGENGIYLEGLPPAAKKKGKKKGGKKAKAAGKKPSSPPEVESKGAALPSWIQFQLDGFGLKDASLTYRDTKAQKEYQVRKINADAAVSLKENTIHIPSSELTLLLPGDVQISTNITNLSFHLASQDLDIPSLQIGFPEGALDLTLKGNLAAMNLDGKISSSGIGLSAFEPLLKSIAPDAPLTALTGKVSPNFSLRTKGTKKFGANGALGLAGIGLESNEIKVSDLAGDLKIDASEIEQVLSTDSLQTTVGDQLIKIQMQVKNTASSLDVNPLTVSGFGGTINLLTNLAHTQEMPVSTTLTMNSVEIGRALSALKPGSQEVLAGTLKDFSTKISLKLSDPDLMKSIRGGGELLLVDAQLKQINLAAEVLGAIRDLPFLTGSLASSVSDDEDSELKKDYTTIHKATATFSVGNAVALLNQLDVDSTLFSLLGKGTSTFTGEVDLDTTILFSEDMSESLVGAVKELEHALDSDNRLAVPLEIQGIAPALTLLPDTKALVKQAAKAVIQKQAGDLIDKALGDRGKGVGKSIENLLGF